MPRCRFPKGRKYKLARAPLLMKGFVFLPRHCSSFLRRPFPVPIAEAGTAAFLAEDRAILFMRYIRKYMAVMEDSKH